MLVRSPECEHCDGVDSPMVRQDELRGWICPVCDSALDEMFNETPGALRKRARQRAALEVMTLDEFRKLHPTAAPEVLEALYDDRLVALREGLIRRGLVAFDEDVTDEEVIADMPEPCPLCGGPQQILGKLGQRVHLRCRDCGADTNSAS
jgi:hypothetical protein